LSGLPVDAIGPVPPDLNHHGEHRDNRSDDDRPGQDTRDKSNALVPIL
jgi:hypothetical protein